LHEDKYFTDALPTEKYHDVKLSAVRIIFIAAQLHHPS